MKRAILLLGLIIFVIAIIQNSQSIALVFFGFETPWELPLSLWIFLFIAAGALTSLLLQFLNFTAAQTIAKVTPNTRSPQPYSPASAPESTPRSPTPEKTSIFTDPAPRERQREFPRRKTQPEPVDNNTSEANNFQWQSKQTTPQEDFVSDDLEAWDIVEPPNEPTPTEKFDPSLDKYKSTVFEARQEPKNISRSGSIYSYTYKQAQPRPKTSPPEQPEPPQTRTDRFEPEPPQTEPIDRPNYSRTSNNQVDRSEPDYQEKYEDSRPEKFTPVYDAKYRVITPPYRDLPYEPLDDDEEDEDWV